MQWKFISSSIITEIETGFTVRLNSGTWSEPRDVAPDNTHISAYDQAKLLRLGLEFARESLSVEYNYYH